MVTDFTEALIAASKEAGLKTRNLKTEKNNGQKDPDWFDPECKMEKKKLIALGKQICKNPNSTRIREELFMKKRQFKKTCRNKKTRYMNKKIKELDFSDSKSVWKNLKSLFKVTKQKQKQNHVDIKDFHHVFKKQNKANTNIQEQIIGNADTDNSNGPLDSEITINELRQALNSLKPRKAAGNDKILNEILIAGKLHLEKPLTSLFNRILRAGVFPKSWCIGHIIPIYKKGDPSDPDNYRGITILSVLSKLFTSVLNNRLYKFLTDTGTLKLEQCGFRKNHSTADCIYTLKALIEKYVKRKPNKKHNLLFTCFVDFKKAFDSIPREILFKKLRMSGVTGKFYSLLKNMYSNDKSCIRQDNIVTETFECQNGVKQGCMLSPTLFNLFLSDLPQALNLVTKDQVEINSIPISCIMYADDLVILSKSAEGLQQYLNELEKYSNNSHISVNIDKTKIMIFNNQGKRMNKFQFYYNQLQLVNVSEFKYLGLVFNTHGNFTRARLELKKTALKALFKLRKEMGNHFRTDIKLTLRLFDTLIKPILLYGSEVRGIENTEKTESKDPGESVHMTFCKLLLGVNKHASHNACRGELGRLPIRAKASGRSLKFWINLQSSQDSKLSNLTLLDSHLNMHKTYWSHKIKNFLFKIGYGNIWLNKEDAKSNQKRWAKNIEVRINDITKQNWLSDIHDDHRKNPKQGNKLRTYRIFKTALTFESYLNSVTNIKDRRELTKLRISDHCLEIEKGRHAKPYKKPEERICPNCTPHCIEDEYHFLTKCTLYDDLREKLAKEMEDKTNTRIKFLSDHYKFLTLINPAPKLQKIVAKYIRNCFEIRNCKLKE